MSDEIKRPAGLEDDEFRREDIDPELVGWTSTEATKHYFERKELDKEFLAERRQTVSQENDPVPERKDEDDGDWKKELKSWLIIIAVAAIIAIVLHKFVLQRTEIISGSMIPTIEINERVIANRLAYLLSDPKRGDVVFFANPDDESETFVKRIIGLPGETVQILEDGSILINGEVLEENYGKEVIRADRLGTAAEPVTLGENEYFVLGDNRNDSMDSRYPNVGPITKDQMIGKAVFRLFPITKIGGID